MHDDDEKCIEKLHDYADPKILAGALALCLDAERGGDDPEQTALAGQVIALVRREVAACDAQDKQLFSAIYGDGKSTEEAAVEIGIPATTARSRHFRLLRALRKAIDARLATLEER
jgi:DNA-directed RNA polymerase specialized sigma24 family protein